MAKKGSPSNVPSTIVKAPTPKPKKPKVVEVDSPVIFKGEGGTLYALDVKDGSYLTTDSDMDDSDITVEVWIKDGEGPVFEDLVDQSGVSGARKIPIPLRYITVGMGHTLLFRYKGKVAGQAAESRIAEVEVRFYDEKDLVGFAPIFEHSELVHNTPTLDMNKFTGDETILMYAHPLVKEGDQFFVKVAGDQDKTPFAFYSVAHSHVVTAAEAVPGHEFRLPLARGWMGRRRPWGSLTAHWGWICDGRAPLPPAEVDPIYETRLPANILEGRPRVNAALIVAPGVENLPPPLLRQSVFYNNEWCLSPVLTKDGGDVDIFNLDTYADDHVCFYASGPGYGPELLGCVTIEEDGDQPSVKLPACVVACFFNKPMTLSYTIAFPNGEGPQPSPEQVVNVLSPELTHSEIEEATKGVVDLNTFSEDAGAYVPVWHYAECSKCCWMWITGKDENGDDIRLDLLMDEPVTDDWKAHGVRTPISRAELQKLDDCSDFELHFAVSFCGECNKTGAIEAPTATFHIVQENLVLPKAKVTQAVGDDLEAWNGSEGVDVEVDFLRMSHKQTISVCWLKKDGTCWPLLPKPGSKPGPVVFSLPREAVIHAIGTTVKINYTVTSACKLATSDDLLLKVSVPHRLPTPVVRQAVPVATQGGILDLLTFVGNANIDVEPWWFILLGQKGWMRGVGTRQNGNSYSFNVYLTKPVTDVSVGMTDVVLRSHLAVLRNNSPLTFTFLATADGSTSESNGVTFPSLGLIFRAGYSNFTSFVGGNRNGWLDGAAAQGENRYDFYFSRPCIANGTLASGSAGILLYKTLTGLEVGRSYRFSMFGCSYNGAAPYPQMSLATNAGSVTPVTTFSAMAWRKIEGTFVANATSMQVRVMTHVASGVTGNDMAVTDLLIEDL